MRRALVFTREKFSFVSSTFYFSQIKIKMPRRPPRNAYYFFMIDFREEQKKKGVNYQNMGEVQVAADPVWRQLHPAERAKYEAMAKKEKEKFRGAPEQKFTSNGISFAEIEAQKRAVQEMEEQELEDIKNFVSQKRIDNKLLEEDIFLIDVNAYCFTGNHYFMAESTILRFSLLEGIKDIYHENINPGRIPIGYASDVKLGAGELGLDMPDDEKRTDYLNVLAIIMDYLKGQGSGRTIPALYTLPEKVEQAQDFIRQLCVLSGEDESPLRVYRLDTLFYHLVNALSTNPEDSFPASTLSLAKLKKDLFRFTPGLACQLHERNDKPVECSKSRVQRWAYIVLDKVVAVAGIQPIVGQHLPQGIDIDAVLAVRDEKKLQSAKAASAARAMSSTCGSVTTSRDSAASWVEKGKRRESAQPALRMPKQDYSRTPELNLTDSNFPKLGGAGRGRGSLSRNMNKLSLNK